MQNRSIKPDWYIICNPASGRGISQKKLSQVFSAFDHYKLPYQFILTKYPHHEEILVQKAIKNGYYNIVCIGGDGTIHHMINGIMKQKFIKPIEVKFAVIPSGTGNDWVKNYKIPRNPKKAVKRIFKNHTTIQDIGKITSSELEKEVYFNNAAGIGFDAFVVKNMSLYKKWGSLVYIIAALKSYKNFKPKTSFFRRDDVHDTSSIFLVSIGICQYSGGGMQLTNHKHHKTGLFDLTIVKSIGLYQIIRQLNKLYNGNIVEVKEAECFRIKEFELTNNKELYIQADGELLGKKSINLEIIPQAIKFIV